MPEGDTIYRLARVLNAASAGATVTRGEVRTGPQAGARLDDEVLHGWESRGKHLLARFSSGRTLHTHLRMDGAWSVLRPGKVLPRAVAPDVRVSLRLADGTTLAGISLPVVELLDTRTEDEVVGFLGPDLLGPDWDQDEAIRRLLRDPDRPTVEALLDQRNLAGIGNLWAVETCYLRGIDPWRPIGEVDLPGLLKLVRRMITHSAETDGRQITTGNTRRGETHWVYGRKDRPCLRCGTLVRFRTGRDGEPYSRETWWCPTCQPAAAPARTGNAVGGP